MTDRDRIDLDQLRRDEEAAERTINRVIWSGLFLWALLSAWLLCLLA